MCPMDKQPFEDVSPIFTVNGWLFIAMLVFAGVNIVFRVDGEGLTFLIAICFVSTRDFVLPTQILNVWYIVYICFTCI